MNSHKSVLMMFALILATQVWAQVKDFTFTLNAKNAQVSKVILGCNAKASDTGRDQLDIPVPPFAMGTGVIGFKTTDQDIILYQDIRSTKLPQAWTLNCKVAKKPIVISWSNRTLPKDMEFFLTLPTGGQVKLTSRAKVMVRSTGNITITARPIQK